MARQLAQDQIDLSEWAPVIKQVVNGFMKKNMAAWAVGGRDDAEQVATTALMSALRKLQGGRENLKGYVAQAMRNALLDAAREGSLIQVPARAVRSAAAAKKGCKEATLGDEQAVRAMRLGLLENVDLAKAVLPEQAKECSQSELDLIEAVGRLPPSIKPVICHLYGLGEYSKLQVADIARLLGVERETVIRSASIGRRMLKEMLGGTDGD